MWTKYTDVFENIVFKVRVPFRTMSLSSKNPTLSTSGTMLLDYEGFVELSEMTKTSFAEFIFERMITRSSDPTEKEGVDAVGFILASYNFCSTPKENLPSFLFDIFSRGNVQMDRLHTVRMIRVLYRSTSQFETKGKKILASLAKKYVVF